MSDYDAVPQSAMSPEERELYEREYALWAEALEAQLGPRNEEITLDLPF